MPDPDYRAAGVIEHALQDDAMGSQRPGLEEIDLLSMVGLLVAPEQIGVGIQSPL